MTNACRRGPARRFHAPDIACAAMPAPTAEEARV